MLSASIDINRARRSTIGLVADSRALAAIRRAAPPRHDADVAPKLAELSERLASAMQDVGGELHELTRGAA